MSLTDSRFLQEPLSRAVTKAKSPLPAQYPLMWPKLQARQEPTSFWDVKVTAASALRSLIAECDSWNWDEYVITSNFTRTPRGYFGSGVPIDESVALWFRIGREIYCIAVGKYVRVNGNLRAITKTLKAVDMMQRYGVGSGLDQFYVADIEGAS